MLRWSRGGCIKVVWGDCGGCSGKVRSSPLTLNSPSRHGYVFPFRLYSALSWLVNILHFVYTLINNNKKETDPLRINMFALLLFFSCR